MPKLTPTQERIMHVLKDGQMHSWKEIATISDPEMPEQGPTESHISRLRQVIEVDRLLIHTRKIDGIVHYILARPVSMNDTFSG